MRTSMLSLLLALAACVTAPMPQVTPGNPNLLSNGDPTDPSRQVQTQGRPCVLACMKGYACNPKTGACDPVALREEPRDGGPAWLP